MRHRNDHYKCSGEVEFCQKFLGLWYRTQCFLPDHTLDVNGFGFCRGQRDEIVISRNNKECPYMDFHHSCMSLNSVNMWKTWVCPHCARLPQFKRGKNAKQSPRSTVKNKLPWFVTVFASLTPNQILVTNYWNTTIETGKCFIYLSTLYLNSFVSTSTSSIHRFPLLKSSKVKSANMVLLLI